MKSKRTTAAQPLKEPAAQGSAALFDRENLLWMAGSAAIIIIGFLLMRGGASADPNVFNKDEVYSTTRITIAPIFVLIGLVGMIFAIFRKSRRTTDPAA